MKKSYYFLLGGLFFILCMVGVWVCFAPNVRNEKSQFVIPEDAVFDQVADSLESQEILKCNWTFRLTAKVLRYPQHIRVGKYAFNKGESNFTLILKLRRGQHFPVKFTFNNVRTKDQLMEKLGNVYFLFEWSELYALLNDADFLKSYGLTPETALAVFIPNTYEFYYDISAQDFFDKMYGYYQKFWNDERKEQAEIIGLSPLQVVTLASIVEEENFRENEKALIAGLYINRLRADMPLQADPTVKFALGRFEIKRVLNEHLSVESPYNTYRYNGLPPGPIRIPATSTVDSVLHYTHHNYLYMCAKEDFSGSHNFTADYQEHLRNAAKYRVALSRLTE